jgi:hypothetical protein
MAATFGSSRHRDRPEKHLTGRFVIAVTLRQHRACDHGYIHFAGAAA